LIIGQCEAMREIQRMIRRLVRQPWPVLLLGETGTGKEMLARAIHGDRPGAPFVAVDCSSLVGPLMESELFGHARGAFTGAQTAKLGLLEAADGGTAFLDEIGELPLDLQSKLLRVLQEKEIRPVGALQSRRVSFRVIAATNRDLAQEVERGAFRRDLYYRLNVVTLRLPALRERKADIPLLIRHFLARHGGQHEIGGDLLELMMNYEWPGNVRELENCIQRMVALNSGPVLHTGDAPSGLVNYLESRKLPGLKLAAAAGAAGGTSTVEAAPVRDARPIIPLAELERQAILHAIEYTKGDRTMAALLLGIGRTTLYRKLRQYGAA
jgi:DNA-binding NtrC family response regulator